MGSNCCKISGNFSKNKLRPLSCRKKLPNMEVEYRHHNPPPPPSLPVMSLESWLRQHARRFLVRRSCYYSNTIPVLTSVELLNKVLPQNPALEHKLESSSPLAPHLRPSPLSYKLHPQPHPHWQPYLHRDRDPARRVSSSLH